MKATTFKILLGTLLISFCQISFAWNHSIELGYGYSHDPNGSRYHNSGAFLSSDIYPLWHTPATFWTINGAIGQWYTTAPTHKNLTTGGLALALRYYPFMISNIYPAYLLASAGPAYLSTRQFGVNKQGSNLAFQLFAGLGVEFNQIDVNLRAVHFSNAYLARPNNGYNILYLLSLGYLF